MTERLYQRNYRYLEINQQGLNNFTQWIKITNNPNKILTEGIILELISHLQYIKMNMSVRVIVLTTELSEDTSLWNFSIADISKSSKIKQKKLKKFLNKLYSLLEELNKITIAAINAPVVGEGLEFISHFDFRFILDDIFLQTNDKLTAEIAKKRVLITNYFSKNEFIKKIQEYADILSKRPPIAVDAIKKCVYYGIKTTLRTGLCIESQQSIRCMISEDAQYAMKEYIRYVKEKLDVPLNIRPSVKEVLDFNQQQRIYENFKGK